MASFNKVFIMGNLTRDIKLTYLPSQTPVSEFSIATSRKFKKQDGTMGEDTCFVDCRIFGKSAEVVDKYLKKGDPIFVEGRLQLDQWEKDGVKQSKLRVFVENFQFMPRKERQEDTSQAQTIGGNPESSMSDDDTDIPF